MRNDSISFSIGVSTPEDILKHLEICDKTFVPPLSERVNLRAYCVKLHELSVTFEAWREHELIGLVAVYWQQNDNAVFISNVSVDTSYARQGVGSVLLSNMIANAKRLGKTVITLEVGEANAAAISFYKRQGFSEAERSDGVLRMRVML